MLKHNCVIKTSGLFGPYCCGRDGAIYDRARKGWLCPGHSRERLCEFCRAERASARACYLVESVLHEAWLCADCIGLHEKG
jgi:hypothetical protein